MIYNLTLLNSVFVCIGVVFDVPVFESYPLSGRWGYSGFLARGYSVILSSIFLIDLLRKQHFNFIKVLLMVVALLCSGTKAGLLSFGFIVFIVMIKKKSIRFGIAGVGAILLVTLPKWMPWLVSFFGVFWNSVYRDHGAWGVLFSLRNQNVERFLNVISTKYNLTNWILGGRLRYEDFWIEIVALDFFGFYGVIGLLTFLIFYLKWLDDWGASIPLLVAFWSGSLIAAPLVYVIWGIYVEVNKQSKIKTISF